MALVTQPSIMPTRKLTAVIVWLMGVKAVIAVVGYYYPVALDPAIANFIEVLIPAVAGWWTRDRPNVAGAGE